MKHINKINYTITLLTIIVILVGSIFVNVAWIKRLVVLNSFNVLLLWWFVSLTIFPRFQSRKPLSEIQSNQEKAEQNWTIFLRTLSGIIGLVFFAYQFYPFLSLTSKVISGTDKRYIEVEVTSIDKGVVPFSIYFYQGITAAIENEVGKTYNVYLNSPLQKDRYEFFVIEGSDIVLDIK